MPPLGPPPQADITTPEKEEILLSPMRIPRCRKSPGMHWSQVCNLMSVVSGFNYNTLQLFPDAFYLCCIIIVIVIVIVIVLVIEVWRFSFQMYGT
jgi:predicted RND superfamily exporter protein